MIFWQVHNEPWTHMVTVYSNILSFEKKQKPIADGRILNKKQQIVFENSIHNESSFLNMIDGFKKEVLRPLKAAQKIQEER